MATRPSNYNKEGKHYASAHRIIGMNNKVLGTFDNLPPFILNNLAETGDAIEKMLDLNINHGIELTEMKDATNNPKINKTVNNFAEFLTKKIKEGYKLYEYETYVKDDAILLNGYIDLILEKGVAPDKKLEIIEIKTRNLKSTPDILLNDKLQLLFYLRLYKKCYYAQIWIIDRANVKPIKEKRYHFYELEREVGLLLDIAITYYNHFIRPEYDPKLITKEK